MSKLDAPNAGDLEFLEAPAELKRAPSLAIRVRVGATKFCAFRVSLQNLRPTRRRHYMNVFLKCWMTRGTRDARARTCGGIVAKSHRFIKKRANRRSLFLRSEVCGVHNANLSRFIGKNRVFRGSG